MKYVRILLTKGAVMKGAVMKKIIGIIILGFGLWLNGFVSLAHSEAPTLSLKDSIPIAEETLAKANMNLGGYYLYAITFSRSSKGDYWYYTFSAKDGAEYSEIFVKVYMDKTAEIVNSASRRGY